MRVIVDPWNLEIKCPRSQYDGDGSGEIRIWGRRRLLTLERLIPHAKSIKVRLLGYGLPSFWMVDLGDITYTLGLSGWTANDWSRSGNFDLLAPRGAFSPEVAEMVLTELRTNWSATDTSIAQKLQLPRKDVLAALGACTQAGRAVFDLKNNLWRARELTLDPLPLDKLRFANDREATAREFLEAASVKVSAERRIDGTTLSGTVIHNGKTNQVQAVIDPDERLTRAVCSCNFYHQNKLRLGPCEHILALRMASARETAIS